MTDTPITSWRTAFAALRQPGLRIEAATVILTAGTLYLACIEASFVVPALIHDFMVRPVLAAAFGREPAPTLIEIAMGVGSGLLLIYRVLPWATRALWAWSRLAWRRPVPGPGRNGDGPTLLALFAMHAGPAYLIDRVMVLNPHPDAPSWLRPLRRWNIMTAWAMRSAELMAEVDRLADAGLLRCTERGRRYRGMSLYEATDLGRTGRWRPTGTRTRTTRARSDRPRPGQDHRGEVMYRVYYGPHLKACCDTPVEAGRHAKLLLLVRGRSLPVRIYSPRGSPIRYGDKR